MIGQRDRYAGNILLYHYLSTKRAPVFLNRNLERILHINQHTLEYGDTDDFPGLDHNLRSSWRPPSHDELDDMMEDSQDMFCLDIHGIKPLVSEGRTQISNDIRRPKRARTLHLKCAIEVKVCDMLSGSERAKRYKTAILSGGHGDLGRQITVQTESINPIRSEELSTDPSSLAKAYMMMAIINFRTDEDAIEFHTYFGSKIQPHFTPGRRLTAHWSNILDCSLGAVVLPLKGNGHLELGLEVSMYWSGRKETILTAHNRDLRSPILANTYPTPPPVAKCDSLPGIELTFTYANETIKRSDLSCPHCTRRPSSILDLRMHLQGVHDNFDYKCVDEGANDAGVQCWRFECEVADHNPDQRASDRAGEPFDVSVMAPEQPFDCQKFLDDGDDSFHQAARRGRPTSQKKGTKKTVTKIVPTERPKPKTPWEVQPRPRKDKRRYLVPKAPRGTTFFRQITKRPLKEGEYISESDEEPDAKWITLRKLAENRKDTHISASAERFLEIYDGFMREEHLQSDVHAGDALIRFVQRMATLLWQERLLEEFKSKIDDLLEENIITKEIHAGSLDIVEGQKSNGLESRQLSQRLSELAVEISEHNTVDPVFSSRTWNEGKAEAKVTDTGFLTPITADGDMGMRDVSPGIIKDWQMYQQKEEPEKPKERAKPVPGRCLCGQDALPYPRTSPVVVCNDIDCVRLFFHLDCIRKCWKLPATFDPNTRDWACDDCQSMDN